jgi:Ca2+:H+ antiporter
MAVAGRTPWWAWAWPALAWVILVLATVASGGAITGAAGAALIAAVFAAVYHAEVVAHRIGEPFGTLVLAVAVTVIEVALIVSVMIAGGADKAGLARDTVFAAVMIVCNGIVGLCLLLGGVRHHVQGFQVEGANAALAVLAALTILTLIVPNVTTSGAGPTFSTASSSSPERSRWCCTARSSSSRLCGTAIISFRSKAEARRPTRRRPPGRWRWSVPACCSSP